MKVDELMAKYGLSAEDVDFSTDGISIEEIENRFAAISRQKKFTEGDGEEGNNGGGTQTEGGSGDGSGTDGGSGGESGNGTGSESGGSGSDSGTGETGGDSGAGGSGTGGAGGDSGSGSGAGGSDSSSGSGGSSEGSGESESASQPDDNDEDDASGNAASTKTERKQTVFSMTAEQFIRELMDVLRTEMVYDDCWGCNVPRYWYVDYDMEANEVYAEDRTDFRLYGMKYTMNGDSVVIDFASKKRKKIVFADFDEGETDSIAVFTCADAIAKERFSAMKKELNELREFKRVETERKMAAERDAKFAEFQDLNGNEAFEYLKANCKDLSAEQIEEKCYAIRGRAASVKFSFAGSSAVRIPVEDAPQMSKDEPYGGIFVQYGVGQ